MDDLSGLGQHDGQIGDSPIIFGSLSPSNSNKLVSEHHISGKYSNEWDALLAI